MDIITDKPILIVEDDASLNKLIQKRLNKEGYNTHGVTNAEAAIEWLSENEFSLVLIDYVLGNTDAKSIIKKVEKKLHFALPFVIMTGNGDERVAVEMMKMGALDYLIKDAAFLDLLPAITKQVLEHLHIKEQYIKSQRELEESEIRHRMLAETINDLISKKKYEGEFIYISPLSKTILGYINTELIGRNVFEFIHPDDKVEYKAYHANLVKNNCSSIIKFRFLKKNGQYVWLETNTRVIRDKKTKQPIELVSVSRDITEIVATEDLKKEKERAELANKAKTEFLANISHEIRNPMNAILGMSSTLLKTQLNEEQKKYINSIRISSSNLMNLINDILDFSKIESKHLEITNTDFDMKELVKEIVTMFENQAQEKNLKLTYNIEKDVYNYLNGDSFKLRQILTNLINNAIKFTEEGEVRINVSRADEGKKSIGLKFEISDTGIGIKEDDFGKIFGLFTQIDSSSSKKYPGTGLGLTIVKKITELLSGVVTFESEFGKGTTFTVHIPFALAKNKSVNYEEIFPEVKSDTDLAGLKVLLAEDDGINQLYLKGFLLSFKCEVDTAFNGEQALEKYKSEKYNIVLMDGQMPKMDGFEATKEIRNHEKENNLPHTPVIAITGYAISGDRERFLAAGMDDYITKPINEVKLVEVIKKYCIRGN